MKEKIPGGPDVGKGNRNKTPRPDTGKRETPLAPDGNPWPAPDVARSADAKPRPERRRRNRKLALAIAAALGTSSFITPLKDAPQRTTPAVENEKDPQRTLEVKEKYSETAEEKGRREELQARLREIVTRLESDELVKNVPMFGEKPDSKVACGFLDTWYKPQKSRMNLLWRYAEARRDAWGPDLRDSMSAALAVSRSAAGVVNWVLPKEKELPVTLEELYGKLDKKLALPPDAESTCGFFFNLGYNYLSGQGQTKNIQNIFRKTISGFSHLISAELGAHAPADRDADYLAASELSAVADSLFVQSGQATQTKRPR